MKNFRKNICLILCISIILCFSSCAFSTSETDVSDYFDSLKKICYSEDYEEISEKGKNKTDVWRNGMISGNGIQGVVASGAPYNDTLIYQNIHFILPNENARTSPDTSSELEAVRQSIVKGEDITDNQSYDDVYMFHPGAELRIKQNKESVKSFFRYTDYETAETGVVYSDRYGQWERSTFTSQTDNVTITKISESSLGEKLNLTLSIDDISAFANYGDGNEIYMKYKIISDTEGEYLAFVAHYPDFENSELQNGGYATAVYILCEGGEKSLVKNAPSDLEQYAGNYNPAISIKDAASVYIIAASDRTYNMGSIDEFGNNESFDIVDELLGKTRAVSEKYSQNGVFDYDAALREHTAVFTPQFNAVELTLHDDEIYLSNETLIKNQRHSNSICSDFAEKAYYSGRYAYLCSSGVSTDRLYGMWTGEWNAGWGSKYTMDANVNLQVSSMNTSNISGAPAGYANFILRQVDDWEENAKLTHGFTDAIQAPVNSDGDMALMTESCYPYPFRYWNAGASWLLQPLYETLQCYGDMEIPITDEFDLNELKSVLSVREEDLTEEEIQKLYDKGSLDLRSEILLPLLIKSANYWAQLLTYEYYTDSDGKINYQAGKSGLENGEKYCIIPSYSPENNPSNYPSPAAANSAIDIAACRNNMEMLIAVQKSVDENTDVSKWQEIIDNLPPYLYDESGALKEWAAVQFDENNTHRHLSHLYCVWPLNETQNNSSLKKACERAIENRESENRASHALIHRALIAARLKDRESVTDALTGLMSKKIYYNSLMTNHHTNRSSAYCTDFAIGYLGIINESLIYSDTGIVEILPALPESGFDKGKLCGIITRSRAEIKNLEWDIESGTAFVTIKSDVQQTIDISCGISNEKKSVDFNTGEEKTVEFFLSK